MYYLSIHVLSQFSFYFRKRLSMKMRGNTPKKGNRNHPQRPRLPLRKARNWSAAACGPSEVTLIYSKPSREEELRLQKVTL